MYREGLDVQFARPPDLSSHLWLWSVLFFGVGDLVTTSIGLGPGGAIEINPVAAAFGHQFGLRAMVGLKAATLGACFAIWQVTPHPHRDGIPLGLTAVGVLVTAWNLNVLLLALMQ